MYRSVFKKFQGRPDDGWAWLWILSRTRWESDGDLERGEVRISSRKLADAMGWHRSKARRFIQRLLRGGEIRPSNRPTNRPTQASPFYVVNYRDLQPSGVAPGPPSGPPSGPHVRKKKRRSQNGAAETPKSEGGSTVRESKRTQPRKTLSLEEQRDFLKREIAKGEGQ